MKYEVFISYSREDANSIAPIVKLVRAMKKNLVFQDIQSIEPGKRWEPQLLNALNQAQIVIVFWCQHAEKSDYVRKEYKIAIKDNKDVLPLLLDDTDLPKALSAYQWIDLREAQFHTPLRPVVGKLRKGGGPHFKPTDEFGNYADLESEWKEDDYERREKAMQDRVAKNIVDGLEKIMKIQ